MDVRLTPPSFSQLNSLKTSPSAALGGWNDALNIRGATPAVTADYQSIPPEYATFRDAMNAATANRAATDVASTTAQANTTQSIDAVPVKDPADAKLREMAEMFVNKLFIGTMLKQMRNSPFKDTMFSGGKSGEAYQGMMDQQIAENAGGKIAASLVNSLVKSYRKSQGTSEIFANPEQQQRYQQYQNSLKANSHESIHAFSA